MAKAALFALASFVAATSLSCSSASAPAVGPTPGAPWLTCGYGGGQGAPSTCLTPKQTPDYYVAQALAYFDTLDTSAPATSVPAYSANVARWEWPPWLKLTGYQKLVMIDTDNTLKTASPSTVPTRNCQAFTVQPFARCYVTFQYTSPGDSGPCNIYEEFTFNDQGEMTFIEAWTANATNTPWVATDRWAEGPTVHRLSTKVPGLGNATGLVDPNAQWMIDSEMEDPDLADLVPRMQDFWSAWIQELQAAPGDVLKAGCGW
jgi:hypothetical protein